MRFSSRQNIARIDHLQNRGILSRTACRPFPPSPPSSPPVAPLWGASRGERRKGAGIGVCIILALEIASPSANASGTLYHSTVFRGPCPTPLCFGDLAPLRSTSGTLPHSTMFRGPCPTPLCFGDHVTFSGIQNYKWQMENCN